MRIELEPPGDRPFYYRGQLVTHRVVNEEGEGIASGANLEEAAIRGGERAADLNREVEEKRLAYARARADFVKEFAIRLIAEFKERHP